MRRSEEVDRRMLELDEVLTEMGAVLDVLKGVAEQAELGKVEAPDWTSLLRMLGRFPREILEKAAALETSAREGYQEDEYIRQQVLNVAAELIMAAGDIETAEEPNEIMRVQNRAIVAEKRRVAKDLRSLVREPGSV